MVAVVVTSMTVVNFMVAVTSVHVVHAVVAATRTRSLVWFALFAAVVPNLYLTNKVMALVTFAFVWRAVALSTWVVIAAAHDWCVAMFLAIVFVLGVVLVFTACHV